MTADEILAGMARTYATCRTYRDTGRVTTRFVSPLLRRPVTKIQPFATAFARPDRFRFEYQTRVGDWTDEWDRYLIWADGEETRTWWDVALGVEYPESLGVALSAANGVSGGSTQAIPPLLLPGVNDWPRLTTLTGVTQLADEDRDGFPCHVLQGRFPYPRPDPETAAYAWAECIRVTGLPMERVTRSPRTLWIDRDSFLLIRMEEEMTFETFAAEQVTTYEPLVNGTLTEDEFRFDPPEDVR